MDGMHELRDVEIEIGDDGVLDVRLVCTIDGSGIAICRPGQEHHQRSRTREP